MISSKGIRWTCFYRKNTRISIKICYDSGTDASALIAAALNEPGGDLVYHHIECAERVLLHSINAFEVVGKLLLRGVPEEGAWQFITRKNIVRVRDLSDMLVQQAVRIKYANPPLSLGDSFCIALGEMSGGLVLTGDRPFTLAKTSAEIRLIRHG